MTTLRDQLDQIARLDKDAIQSSPMSIPIEHLCDSNAVTAFKNALVSFYRSGALQRLAELAEEVSHIAKAERFNREKFGDDTAYADWVQSRCRFVLSARAPSAKEK